MKYLLPFLTALIFIAGCARQTSPTGGPKDTIPPKLVSSNPRNEQTNFNGKNVTLEFTELINLNSAKEQVIITPSIGKEYEINSKNKTVIIDLNAKLDSNTTYTINFRDAVQDITERNPVKDLKLAFSTGSYVDSLSLSGKVTDIITTKELKEITVALQHVWGDTMSIMKHSSFYFTKTNEKGEFKLDYIKPGTYQLYAFQDKNKNLIIDPRNEAYGFISKYLQLENDTSKLQLKLIRLDTRPLKLTSARPYSTYFNIKTTKNLQQYKITSDDEDVSSFYGEDQANIRVYNTFPDRDSLQIKFVATDSSGSSIDTTLFAKFRKDKNIDKEKFTMSIAHASITARTGQIKIKYTFNKPVAEFNLDSIYYRKDTLNTINFTTKDVNWDPETNSFTIEKYVDKDVFLIPEVDPGQQAIKQKDSTRIKPINELLTKKGAFISVEGDSSAAVKQTLKSNQPSDLSEIFYDARTKKKNIIVQLLTKEFKLVRQDTTALKGSFADLPPGDYIVRYVVDSNNNGRWDPGNYFTKEEPEQIFYSTDPKGTVPQSLKANWELELAPMLISD